MKRAPQPAQAATLAFAAGVLAALVFQQGLLALLRVGIPSAPGAWSLRPVPRLGLPEVAVWALVGGGGAMVLGHLLRGLRVGPAYWVVWIAAGAVALGVVAWLWGAILGALWPGTSRGASLAIAVVINGAWGLGTALLLRIFRVQPGVQRAT